MKHTILGAGGAIGNALTDELLKNKQTIRSVSRSGKAPEGTEVIKADIHSYPDLAKSIEGADVVYLLAGLQYNRKVWAEQWPGIMQNTIDACKAAGAKLIFFDNVYMYGKVEGKMTEETPYNPCSKKGEIRAQIAGKLQEEIKSGNIKASIARSADFYGPYATFVSIPYVMALDKLLKGKKAQWLVNAKTPHSYTYTRDCGKALSMMAGDEASFGQVWHLPTHNPGINGKTFIELAAKELGVSADYTVLKKWMVRLGGYFDTTIKEILEMTYQYEFPYYFDSSKFNNYFNYQPVGYEEGMKKTIEFLRR